MISSVVICRGTRSCATSSGTAGRVVLRCAAVPGVYLNEYAVLRAHAAVEPSDNAWNLLSRLATVCMPPDAEFPVPKGPDYVVRYSVERIGGVGP
jgi:hypothetical protein